MTTSSFPKKLNFLDQTSTNGANDTIAALTATSMSHHDEKNSFDQHHNDYQSTTSFNNNNNDTTVGHDEHGKDAKHFTLNDEDDDDEVLKDLEGEDDDDNDDDDEEKENTTNVDYFKIIDRKLELEKLKKKSKHQQQMASAAAALNSIYNKPITTTTNASGPYSCVNKYDNFRTKSIVKASAWEISPTKPPSLTTKTTTTASNSLHFNKFNYDHCRNEMGVVNDDGEEETTSSRSRVAVNREYVDQSLNENDNECESQEKLFTYHRYKLETLIYLKPIDFARLLS